MDDRENPHRPTGRRLDELSLPPKVTHGSRSQRNVPVTCHKTLGQPRLLSLSAI